MKWITADTHFNHKNIIKYCNRPFNNVGEMNYVIMKRWNETVKENDVIYHLGDFAFGNKEEIRNIAVNLNGYKILIRGNHDKKDLDFYKEIFDEVYDGLLVLDNLILTHTPINLDIPILNVGVDNFNFFPIPLPTTKQRLALCGHSHEKWLINGGD